MLTDTEEENIVDSITPKESTNKIVPRSKKRRFGPLKVANQIPKSRRLEIEKGLEKSSKLKSKISASLLLVMVPKIILL